MRVALNGWFAGREVGSGQYTDRLVAALAATAPADESTVLVTTRAGGPIRKTWFEQLAFPAAARWADLAHVPYWGPPLAAPRPLVVTVHDLIPLLLPEYRKRWLVRVYARLAAAGTRRAAAIITDAQFTAAQIVAHLRVPEQRVAVIPLAVDSAYRPDADSRRAKARYELPEQFGLYLGGFDLRKNLATLLAAWRQVYETTGVRLLIAGRIRHEPDGVYRDPRLVAASVGLPALAYRCLGYVPEEDKPGLYAAATVFAYPSRYEGFGLPPLEAMACGTPTVVADATSLPEVVGEAALRLPADDVRAWAEALIALLTDSERASSLGAAGREHAQSFSWHRTAQLTRQVYEQVLHQDRRARQRSLSRLARRTTRGRPGRAAHRPGEEL